MPHGTVVSAPRARVAGRGATTWRPALVVVGLTLAIRCLQLVALAVASRAQSASGPRIGDGNPFQQYFVFAPSPASPGVGTVLTNWDGQWYMRIAVLGYPHADQVGSANDAWVSAFPPGFPLLARATMSVTGLPFGWASFVLNTALTLVAVVLLCRLLLACGLGARVAVAAGVGVSLLPASPVLVTAYSEALALALVVLALRLLVAQRYLWTAVVVAALSFTRPIAIAFVPVLLVHAALRWRADRSSLRRRDWAGMGLAGVVALVSPWVWPVVVSRLTGVTDRNGVAGSGRTEQIVSGLGSGYLPSAWSASGVLGLLFVLLCALVLVGVPTVLGLRLGWPVELLAWGVAYVAMVLVVTPTTPGFLRYLVLAAPLFVVLFAAPVAHPNRTRVVVLVLLACCALASQWLWIRYLFVLDPAPSLLPWAP